MNSLPLMDMPQSSEPLLDFPSRPIQIARLTIKKDRDGIQLYYLMSFYSERKTYVRRIT